MIKPQDILNKSLGPPRPASAPAWEERVKEVYDRHDRLRL